MGINVLSCFDGISCGQLALQRAGIEVDNYFASEIDKYAIKIAAKNFPNTIHLGDIQNWQTWNLPRVDLLIGGSPCQGFSNAGLGLNFDDPRSKLFFTFVDILKALREKNPDMKFLLENVKMKKEWKAIITDYMKVEPVLINSALLSAQNRERLYWANWEFGQPEDKGIYLKDIIEDGKVDREKSYSIDANYHKGGNPRLYFEDGKRQLVFEHQSQRRAMVRFKGAAIRNQVTKRGVEEQLNIRKDEKSNCVVPSYPHKLNGVVRIGTATDIKGHDYNKRIYSIEGKSPTLAGNTGGNLEPNIATRYKTRNGNVVEKERKKSSTIREAFRIRDNFSVYDGLEYRKLTPLECERLQTLPEGYTEGISNTQRYKCIGNGWTVDVLAHIFSHLKEFYTV